MKGHHGAQLHGATAYETPFGPWWRTRCMYRHRCRSSAAATGETGSRRCHRSRARSRSGRVAHGAGQSPSEELSQGAGAFEVMVDILPAGVPRTARLCKLVSVFLQLAHGCATQRQNHERTDTVPLRPGARDRPAGGARSRGRRVPIEGVLLLIALLAQWRPDDEDPKPLFLVDGTTRPTRLDNTIHTPHEPPLDFQRKRSGEDRRARRTRGTRPRRALREQRGWLRGRQGVPLTLLTQEPRDGGCPQRSTGRRARAHNGPANDVRVSPADGSAGATPGEEV